MQTNKKDILLESGTNELEIMEFKIGDRCFAINIAKIVEIMKYVEIMPITNSNPYVEGIFKPRNEIITVIDLASYLGLSKKNDVERDILIITYFNKITNAFHVDSVEAIHRISWENIEKPNETINSSDEGLATGIAKVDGRLITIIDFEKILVDINPNSGIQLNELKQLGSREENTNLILLAEDSPLLSKMILSGLEQSGYTNIIHYTNGAELWNALPTKNAKDIRCIITDIEMPLMDGHLLLKNIRDSREYKDIPVLIFSSLIDDSMREKGLQLGVTEQISKPEITKLINSIDKYIIK